MSTGAPASTTGVAPSVPVSQAQADFKELKDEALGATVRSFDPDASPAEKAQQVLKGAPSIESADLSGLPSLRGDELKKFKETGGSEMASDIGSSGQSVKTTTSLKEVNALANGKLTTNGTNGSSSTKSEEKSLEKGKEGPKDPAPPGALPEPEAKIREIPEWFEIGWNGQNKTLFLTPEEQHERSILSEFISEAYYGQWWHNAGIIVFATVASHFVTLFGGGWGWLILILATSATAYQTSIKRTTRNVRDDMTREVAKKGLKADVESATWLNLFLARFWKIYEPILSATIVASVDQVLSVSTPAFLDSIRMTTFTLGTKAPHIDHVRTFADTDEDIVMMEWKISFVPNDIENMTKAAADQKVNPKIVLNIRLGIGPAVVGKDIIVEDLSFQGTMRVRMKLMTAFPHVQLVDLSFMQPPVFDFVLKPVGFDLSLIPGLSPFITSQVHATLAPMMYAPNTFTLNLEQMLSGAPLDTACGVLAIHVYGGRGIKGTKLGGGAPDPYISFSIAGRAEIAKTKVKKSTTSPQWGETKYILLNNLNENLGLTIMDWNEHRPDSELGVVNFDLKSLAEDGQQEGINGDIIYDGKARGQVKYDAVYYPVLKAKKLPDGSLETIPETTSGVVRLVIHQAKELDPRGQQINPFAQVTLNNNPIHRSQTLKRSYNPVWERPTEFLVTDKKSAVIGVAVVDDNSIVADTKLGHVKVKLTDILEANEKGQDWFPLSNARSGRVRLTAEWKPVLMAGAISGAGAYTPPIGVVRVLFKHARDLKNVEALTGGKSDPYARVLHGGIVIARTQVIDNDLDPDWDEISYIQVHSKKDQFVLEVMDYQHLTKDRSLGVTEFGVSDLFAQGPDPKTQPWVGTGKQSRKQSLKIDGKTTTKGHIEYEVEFFPCAHLKNVSFTAPEADKITEIEENGTETDASTIATTAASTAVNGSELAEEDPNDGVDIPRDTLIKTQTGVLAFQIISGQLAKKGARVEVLFDDGYWPAYSTEAARSTHAVFDEIGEAVIRELDYSHVILKLNTADRETREDIIGTATIDMNVFLESCLDKPATFTLTDPQNGVKSTVKIMAKYIPINMEILARESFTNSGTLKVDLLDGKGIPAADRNGKSDPYAVFVLNDEKVFKSEVVKKTLAPTWNEKFETSVGSRVGDKFFVDVYDWDRVGTANKLARGQINLADLEPMEQVEQVVPLTEIKTGKEHGSVRVKLLFRPAFLVRSRKATSTFSSAGRAVGGGVLAAGGGVLHGGSAVLHGGATGVGAVGKLGVTGVGVVGKGAAKGVGGVLGGVKKVLPGGGGSHNRHASLVSQEESPASLAAYDSQGLPISPNPNGAPGSPSGISTVGSLSVTVLQLVGAGDVSEKKFVTVKSGGKTVKETKSHHGDVLDSIPYNETAVIKTGETPVDLEFAVFHKKTFGSDKAIGTALILNVWDSIPPGGAPTTLNLPLEGGDGQLVVSLSWVPLTPSFLNSDPDTRSIAGSVSPSIKARSRFSSGRFSMHRSREQSIEPSD